MTYSITIDSEVNSRSTYPETIKTYCVTDDTGKLYYKGNSEDKAHYICSKMQAFADLRDA